VQGQLRVTPSEMRRLGYQTVDLLVDLLSDPDTPALRRANAAEMASRIAGPPPEEGRDFDAVLAGLADDVFPFMSRCDHPRYFAFIPACGTWPGALGDFMASALNIFAGSWMESAGPSQVELTVLDWFKSWIGYPAEAAGVLVAGGSAANMTALACAREARLGAMTGDVVAYVSDQAHSSMARAARVLGFRPDQVRVLPVDSQHRMRPQALAGAMDADTSAGRRPLLVAASAGSTNTGAIDPLPELAAVCRDRGVWLHVDAAYGGFAALTERGRRWLSGIELADSVTLDPHKWLYQPFECGSLLVREGRLLRQAFEVTPDYLKDAEVTQQEVNFSDLGVQLTRMSRALKLWCSLHYFGVGAFRQSIDATLDLAGLAQEIVEASPELELLNPATLGIVCFRRRPPGLDDDVLDALNTGLVSSYADSGDGLVSSTRLRGRLAVRLCVLNHTSGAEDVRAVLRWFADAPVEEHLAGAAAGTLLDDNLPATIDQSWLARRPVGADELARLPLFAGLPDADLEAVARASRTTTAAPGEALVRQWEAAHEFYVIVSGSVGVNVSGRHVTDLGPGDCFGELATMEWGSSYSYPRLATVTATAPVELLAWPGSVLRDLVASRPVFGQRLKRIVAERLVENRAAQDAAAAEER
jgi:aromatic-L-amino-acid/L-tryptophan decarboxylase